ncbi:hypothetical protein K501DRAFT_287489 [Backusella circina FSU 941]|nr:hypothetical protein K501DRAFT_287489 [Backusella circina FSU 941]
MYLSKALLSLTLFTLVISVSCQQSSCRIQQQNAKPGEFVPHCDSNGDYTQIQKWPENGQMWYWCVDKNGNQVTEKQKTTPTCP